MDVKEMVEMRAQLERDIRTELCHYIDSFEGATGVCVAGVSVDFIDASTVTGKRYIVSNVTVKLEIE